MKVKELIEKLSKLPQDAEICLWSFAKGEVEAPVIQVHDTSATTSRIELVAQSDLDVE